MLGMSVMLRLCLRSPASEMLPLVRPYSSDQKVHPDPHSPTSKHTLLSLPTFVNGVFGNPWPAWEQRSFSDVFKWQFMGQSEHGKVVRLTQTELDAKIPVMLTNRELLKNPDKTKIQHTWIGHATSLVQMEGINFLTDPVWSQRASLFEWIGPKRIRPLPISLQHLPKIDFVILSHDHYDHCDVNTIKAIGNNTLWIAPKGFKQWFAGIGITNCVELTWWEKYTVKENMDVVLLPAQHWCKRSLRDDMIRLWGGFAVLGKQQRVYFAGDTGYCDVFTEIGNQYGPFDLSLIPIGAYSPRWFMSLQHVNPAEAVQIHKDIKSRKSVGIHWGTFILTDEPEDEPPKLLKEEAHKAGLKNDEFVVTKIGESIQVG